VLREEGTPTPALSGKAVGILVVTHFTSPYQTELFDAIVRTGRCVLEVFYLYSAFASRSWGTRRMNHPHIILADLIEEEAHQRLAAADLVVFNFYDDPRVASLMKSRVQSGKPWCFWGERPGAGRYGWLGYMYRLWRLAPLHESRAPIWGTGRFALEQYRREFGAARILYDLPYYSNLSLFGSEPRSGRRHPGQTTFLCSGSLIPRKGVDLLARAFLRLAAERTDVRLKFMGDGEMRPWLQRELQPVADRVEFTGFRDWEYLPAEYRTADVLCVPSRHDGWGLVVPEALAAGVPVIATDRTGAALELLQPRRNGWLIPANDETALFAAMADAASLSEDELRACSAAAVVSVAEHTLEDGVNRFLEAAARSVESWPGPRLNSPPATQSTQPT
jgi:glycosyltransferase involved in cell wall biosynthesis